MAKGGPTDFVLKSPKEMARIDPQHTEKEWREIASNYGTCDCGSPIWRYGQSGMCFSCTTGESDASEDYEVIP